MSMKNPLPNDAGEITRVCTMWTPKTAVPARYLLNRLQGGLWLNSTVTMSLQLLGCFRPSPPLLVNNVSGHSENLSIAIPRASLGQPKYASCSVTGNRSIPYYIIWSTESSKSSSWDTLCGPCCGTLDSTIDCW